MKSDEIRTSPEVGPLGYENLFDELEAVDDDAGAHPEGDAVDVAVGSRKLRKRLERARVLSQKMEASDDRKRLRPGRALPQFGLF